MVSESFLACYPILTIHNGVDLSVFKPTDSDFRRRYQLDNKFIVLGVADGFGERKGSPDFNSLNERLGDDVKVVMVGVRPKDKKRISENILTIERTQNQQELVEIYSVADVFINPTYEDNFPTTNLEALACGTPVITYRTGGCPEAIDDKTGIVVEKGNVRPLGRCRAPAFQRRRPLARFCPACPWPRTGRLLAPEHRLPPQCRTTPCGC